MIDGFTANTVPDIDTCKMFEPYDMYFQACPPFFFFCLASVSVELPLSSS